MQMVLASKDKTFTIVKAVSDAYVPSCKVWIGDYPYLDKREFKLLMRQIMKSKVAPSSLLRDESEDVLASQRRSQRKVRRSQNGSSGSVLSSPDVTYRLPPPRDSNTRRSRVDQDDEDDFRYDDRLDEEDAFDQ